MITIPAGARILLATRPIDFRRGGHSLAALAQEVLGEDPFSGAVIVYRAKRSDRVKILGRIQVVVATPPERKLRCKIESGGRDGRRCSHLVAHRRQDATRTCGSGRRLRPVWRVRMPQSRQVCRRR
jgi:hypothetical protein